MDGVNGGVARAPLHAEQSLALQQAGEPVDCRDGAAAQNGEVGFLASVMASAAQWERRIIGQRTREALAAKKAAGVQLGRPPLIPARVLARMVEMRAAGMTFRAVADVLN